MICYKFSVNGFVQDCISLIKEVVSSEGLSEALLSQGSAYSGTKKNPESSQEQKIISLEKRIDEMQKSRAQADNRRNNNNNNSGGYSGNGYNNNARGRGNRGHRGGGSSRGGGGGGAPSSSMSSGDKLLQKKLSKICSAYNQGLSCPLPCKFNKRHVCNK